MSLKIDLDVLEREADRGIATAIEIKSAIAIFRKHIPVPHIIEPEVPEVRMVKPRKQKRLAPGKLNEQVLALITKKMTIGEIARQMQGVDRGRIRGACEFLTKTKQLHRQARKDKSKRWGEAIFYSPVKHVTVEV